VRVFLITAAALSLSFYAPSALGQSSATQALDRAYCDDLDESHPDYYECWLDQILSEDAASREVTTEESAQLDEMVESSRLIAAERSENSQARRVLRTVEFSALGGVGGGIIGFMAGLGGCALTIGGTLLDFDLDSVNTDCWPHVVVAGTLVGVAIGIPIGAKKGWRAYSVEDTQVTIAPYRYDDASGLMFSGQF
jgi:hypothetical protein